MSPLASLAAMPALALTACGGAPPAPGPAQTGAKGSATSPDRRINGLPMPDGRRRIYECNATLSSPMNDTLRTYVGQEPLPFLLIRTEGEENTFWAALGHLDNADRRRADPPFPATARTEGERTILEWNIHSTRAVASVEWSSPAQDHAALEIDVTGSAGYGPRDQFPYHMRGACIENRRHPLATPSPGDARS
jgi:hypothetical protein